MPTPFDGQTMKDKNNDEESDDEDTKRNGYNTRQRLVEIVVTPALFKRGTSEGERYESETCIVRADVTCADARVEAVQTVVCNMQHDHAHYTGHI